MTTRHCQQCGQPIPTVCPNGRPVRAAVYAERRYCGLACVGRANRAARIAGRGWQEFPLGHRQQLVAELAALLAFAVEHRHPDPAGAALSALGAGSGPLALDYYGAGR